MKKKFNIYFVIDLDTAKSFCFSSYNKAVSFSKLLYFKNFQIKCVGVY